MLYSFLVMPSFLIIPSFLIMGLLCSVERPKNTVKKINQRQKNSLGLSLSATFSDRLRNFSSISSSSRKIGETLLELTSKLNMTVTSFPSHVSVSYTAKPPLSPFSAVFVWKQALRFGRKKKKPRVVSCDYSCLEVKDVCYSPPGTQMNILNGVNFSLRKKSFGLIFGKSGSGKTTLLQILAGLNKPTSGSICIQRYGDDGQPLAVPELLPPEKVGIVFQFPERFFVADNVLDEITFGWPRQKGSLQLREQLTSNLQRAFNWVGLDSIPLDKDPQLLSGGYKRRLALAIQLVQTPDLLILDEPLAGLDWKARADVAKLLKHLKKELTLLVVSHDLRELTSLVDQSWRMETGGVLIAENPPV